MGVPRLTVSTHDVASHRLSNLGIDQDKPIELDSGNTDAGNTPTTRIRPGTVVVLRTSTSRYVEADDVNGDRGTAAAITTATHVDGNGVISIVGPHGTISVTTTTGTGTEAENATDLNADAAFAAHYVASSAGGELTITARNFGDDEWFYMHADTMATAPFAEGEANGVVGTYADYWVTEFVVDLIDEDAVAIHEYVTASRKGHYDESVLLLLTDEAKQTLLHRGSIFD